MATVNKIAIDPDLEVQNIELPQGTEIIGVGNRHSQIVSITVLYHKDKNQNTFGQPILETRKLVISKPFNYVGNYKTIRYIGNFYILETEYLLFEVE